MPWLGHGCFVNVEWGIALGLIVFPQYEFSILEVEVSDGYGELYVNSGGDVQVIAVGDASSHERPVAIQTGSFETRNGEALNIVCAIRSLNAEEVFVEWFSKPVANFGLHE